MDSTSTPGGPDDLSLSEKILHVQDLWDEIARSSAVIGLTDAQREAAERRLDEHESAPGQYSSWQQVRQRSEGEP